jgi:hypothetical protein
MTEDVSKFLRKEAEVMMIMDDIRIGIWNFVLPSGTTKIFSSMLGKSKMRSGRGSPSTKRRTFRISVITADEFAVEVRELTKQDLYQFNVKGEIPDSVAAVAKRFGDNNGLEITATPRCKSLELAGRTAARQS